MIHSPTLLADLRRLLKTLDADLRDRIGEQPAVSASLQAEWQAARAAGRTAASQTEWLDEEIT
jgi:hypothetical protein